MEQHIRALKKDIREKQVKIAVIGLGYVGLPLAVEFAQRGFRVLGIDVDKGRIDRLRKKVSYITDISSNRIKKVVSNGSLTASGDFSCIMEAGVIIICVPTPLKRKYHPDISFIMSAVKQIKKFLRKGHLVILESTTYPGTTEEMILPVLEESGLKCGRDFFLAFSPERIDPGNKKYPVHKIPKVIGGITPLATDFTKILYRHIVSQVVGVSSARVAETVKLLENTFRIVNIGLINEMAMMAHKMNIDIWEIIEAAKTKPFGFMPFYPGPGVGGHCIPKDPLYLYWKAKHYGFRSRYIKLSSEIIGSMPDYVVERISVLMGRKIKLKPRILIIGVTYKKDIFDLRKSPALDIIDNLIKRKWRVSYYDPIVPYLKFSHIDLKCMKLTGANLRKFDCAIIVTDHSIVDYGLILKNSRLILDTRNAYKGMKNRKIFRL